MHVPKYRHNKQRNYGFVEWHGQRYRLPGKYGSAESWEAYTQFLADHCGAAAPKPTFNAGPGLTFKAMVAQYLTYAQRHYQNSGPRGEYANMRNAVRPALAAFGDHAANTIGPLKIKALQRSLIEQTARKKTTGRRLSRGYINDQIARLKRVFKWAASEELIPITVYQGIATVQALQAGRTDAREADKPTAVPWEHIEPILGELSPVIAGMLWTQWHLGVRSKSLCWATPSQFDRSGELWLWRPRHKTEYRGMEVVVPVGPLCQSILEPFFDRGPDDYLFNPRAARANRRYGRRYSTGSYRQAVQRAIKRVNKRREEENKERSADEQLPALPVWSPHGLRRTRGHEVRAKYGIEAVQAVLGHVSLKAAELYSERRLELAKRIAREVG